MISGSNDYIKSYGSARQGTSDDEEVYYVNQEHYRRERNAFHLAKLALEAEEKKEKDLWSFDTTSSNDGSPFSKK
jgi:hypothetical protein